MDLIVSLKKVITCSLCLDIYRNPVTFGACRHSFCEECALDLLEFQDICPLCSVKLIKINMTSLHCLNQIIAVAQSLVHETLLLNDSKYLASHKASLLTSSSSTSKPTLELVKFNEGDLVEVQARTWAGINKPGGAARIISFSAEEGSYEVKYVLTGAREKGILSVYMTSLNIEALPTNRRKPRGLENTNQEQSDTLLTEGKENLLNPNPSKKQKKVTNSVTSTGISRPIVLLTSGLDDEDSQQLIAKFVDAFPHASVAMAIEATSTSSGPASTANIYVDKSYDAASAEANASVETAVTHLVVPVDRHNVFPHRTIKYLQAMIAGLWIVSPEWLHQSLRRGLVLREEEYEVVSCSKAFMPDAPRRARVDRTVNTSFRGLFRDVVAIIHGQFPLPMPQRSKLAYLLNGGRARLCDSVDSFVNACVKAHSGGVFNSSSQPIYKVVICSDIISANQFINDLTELTSGDPLRFPKNFLKRYHIHVVSSVWVLDCVANYNVIKPESGSGQYDLVT